MRTRPRVNYHAILPKKDQIRFLRSSLRSVGLRFLTLHERISGIALRDGKEQEQVLVNNSRKIALSRVAVHILPIFITLLLLCMNAIEILNEPQITVIATFFLQVAAKFHELTIAGSLTAVVLDVIRHELLHEGLNLGLLVAGYSMSGISFLWSPEMLSMFKASYARTKKLWLFSTIATCCILLAVVGPSSALLFVPTSVWKLSGGTEFYLGSTSDDLWPSRLTAQHTGPKSCLSLGSTIVTICPAGGYEMVAARILKDPQTGYTVFLQDAHFTREIVGWTPRFNYSWDQQDTQESWVMTPRGDVTFMMQDLGNVFSDAQTIAKGRNRRLRDFVDGSYVIAESRIPAGRTVCGPAQLINNDTKTIAIPVLKPDQKWRNISFGSNQVWGQLADYEIDDLLQTLSNEKEKRVFARWTALGPEYGAATAGLVVLSRNASHTVGRGCVVDYRWALGQTYSGSGMSARAYTVHVGKANTPSSSQNAYSAPPYQDFLHPTMIASYSETITADQDWLDAAFPLQSTSDQPDGYNMTTFEAMISRTIVQDLSQILSHDSTFAFLALSSLEYIAGVAFIDILARTNWYKSLKYPDNSMMISPALQQLLPGGPQPVLTDGQIYKKPDNISTTTLHVKWHAYGTVWTLYEPGQFMAVVVLSLYVSIALVHGAVTLSRGTSMEAWDSILELVLLAWNSMPTRRDDEFVNASVGIHRLKTVTHKVKVVVVERRKRNGDSSSSDSDGGENDDRDGQVELILLDERGNNVDGRGIVNIVPGELYR